MASRGQTRQMGHLGARDEGEARSLRQAEQFFEPSSSHLFEAGFGGSAGMDGCVLIPNRCQPVGCERRRQRSSNDPAKKAAACTADYSAFAITHQIIDHLRGIGTDLRQWLIEPLAKLLQAGCGASRSIVHS